MQQRWKLKNAGSQPVDEQRMFVRTTQRGCGKGCYHGVFAILRRKALFITSDLLREFAYLQNVLYTRGSE